MNEEYKMNHPRRGTALIFNNENFNPRLNLPKRSGTTEDCHNLQKVLLHLGFLESDIKIFYDFTVAKIKKEINEVAKADHKNADCLFVAILSHGDYGYVYGYDSNFIVSDLWEPFSAQSCPSLARKPKLFFIQACQGNQFDSGYEVSDVTDGSVTWLMPSEPDFLIEYSTVPGFFSWRNKESGSWFVQAVCKVFLQRGREEDIINLILLVHRTVAIDFESTVPDTEMDQKKQIPCLMYTLTKSLFFRPKADVTAE